MIRTTDERRAVATEDTSEKTAEKTATVSLG